MKTELTHARNSLQAKARIEVSGLLQEGLAYSIDLMMRAKQAHRGVKRQNFIAQHELFDKVYIDTGVYVDLIAARIVQLGGTAHGVIRVAAEKSSLAEDPANVSSGSNQVAELARAIAFYGDQIRKGIKLCHQLKDAGTADIFTKVSCGADLDLRFMEAHGQANDQAGHENIQFVRPT